MDGHGRSTTTSVAELRLRLYRPEPPAGAVAAYLAALRTQPVLVAGAPAAAARAHHHRHSWPLAAVAVGACLVGAVAASTLVGRQVPTLVAPPAARTTTSTSSTSRLPAPPLMGVPLGDLFGTGPATRRFSAKGHRVVASVLCSGVATLAVRIGSEPPTLLSCEAGPAAFAVVASAGPQQGFSISVTPDAPIRWSLAAAAVG